MALNIKNPETVKLARELAELTGESLTTTVTVALEERRNRVRSEGMAARILDLSRDTARRMSPETCAIDHGELLYGPDGLPW